MRAKTPKVSKDDLDRALELVRKLGLRATAVEVEPGRVRILSGDHRLTLPDEQHELEEELRNWAAGNGGHG
jgi:hypothetical protein